VAPAAASRAGPSCIAAPHEPSAAERARRYSAREVVAVIDSILEGQQTQWPEGRNTQLIDVLLDLRNMLAVPVIPGRPS
jgi:hypothetical protein